MVHRNTRCIQRKTRLSWRLNMPRPALPLLRYDQVQTCTYLLRYLAFLGSRGLKDRGCRFKHYCTSTGLIGNALKEKCYTVQQCLIVQCRVWEIKQPCSYSIVPIFNQFIRILFSGNQNKHSEKIFNCWVERSLPEAQTEWCHEGLVSCLRCREYRWLQKLRTLRKSGYCY